MTGPGPACFYNMHDGRMFTDYRPRCTVEFENAGSQSSSYLTRQHMIQNAEKMISQSLAMAQKNAMCGRCLPSNDPGTMLPEAHMQKCDERTCTFNKNVNPGGVGTGRVYS